MKSKKSLTQLINEKGIQFDSNNLVLTPLGSGEAEFISKLNDKDCLIISPNSEMTYEKFGEKIKYDNSYVEKYKTIICDKIHSIYNMNSILNNVNLAHSIKFLFDKHEGKQIFYFTSNDESLKKMVDNGDGTLDKVTVYDFMSEKELMQYAEKSVHNINHIDQIKEHLEANKGAFIYFENKAFIYTKTIQSQKKIAELAESIGLKPLIVSTKADSKSQIQLINDKLPKEFDVLITDNLNLNLNDENIQIVIINSSDENTFIQARCLIKQNIDYLVKLVELATDESETNLELPEFWLNTELTTKMKSELCKQISQYNENGVLLKWTSVKKMLIQSGYNIDDKYANLKGKRTRVSVITK